MSVLDTEPRSERIDLRLQPSLKHLLQQAAQSCNKTISEFVLDAVLREATETLTERRLFALNEQQWQAFQKALDRPPQARPRLQRLLQKPGVFETP